MVHWSGNRTPAQAVATKVDTNMTEISVYYDGACPLCSREIDLYRKKDVDHKIDFVDISAPSFDAQAHGLDPVAVHKVFHVRDPQGNIYTKVEGFKTIWTTLGICQPLVRAADNPVLRMFMDFGYLVFARVRPWLPKNKSCQDGSCDI